MNTGIEAVIKDVNSSLPQRKLIQMVERANMSADMKALLVDLARITVKVAGKVLSIGRKILSFVFDIIKLSPTITLGVLAAITVSALIGSIPILGGVLTAVLSPLLLAAGVGMGAMKDLTSERLQTRLDNLIDSFSALKEA